MEEILQFFKNKYQKFDWRNTPYGLTFRYGSVTEEIHTYFIHSDDFYQKIEAWIIDASYRNNPYDAVKK